MSESGNYPRNTINQFLRKMIQSAKDTNEVSRKITEIMELENVAEIKPELEKLFHQLGDITDAKLEAIEEILEIANS